MGCRAGWRSSLAGDRVGPSARCVYPTQGPYAPGLRASVAAAAERAIVKSPESLQVLHGTWSPCLPLCSARPIINAGRAARVLPIARGTAAGLGCQGAHASARTQGKEPEGHSRVLKEKRVPGPTAVRVKTDVPTL